MDSLCHHSHEELVTTLQDPENLKQYQRVADGYEVHWLPKSLGEMMVFLGNITYGKEPSYGKFKAIEVIARIPYQSWEVASYMFLTFFYANEEKALTLSRTSRFSRMAQDNETMHVVVISQLAKKHKEDSLIRHTAIPVLFSFVYFLSSFLLYIIHRRYSFQLNYLFECHAFEQYQAFVNEHEEHLKKEIMMCNFLDFYGRYPKSEYEFFQGVMIDELIHRNQSMTEAER